MPGNSGGSTLSVALIGPDPGRREEVANVLSICPGVVIREFPCFPASLEDLPQLLEQNYEVVLIDLDSDPEYALDLVEGICAIGSTAVMVYSDQVDLKLALRFMSAGARDFLTLPLAPVEVARALSRVAIRHEASRQARRPPGKLSVFFGSKGGCGVTTVAANFAVSLAQVSNQNTLLIDLGLPLGDAAINLGIVAEFSTAHAFQDPSRLDAKFLSSLLTKHSSGLFVLAAPADMPPNQPPQEAVARLITVARQRFDYVVIDGGARLDLMDTNLFGDSATVYLVAQVGVSELRNANRLISRFLSTRWRNLQIVLNRYTPHMLLFDEEHITKALTQPANWKIPDDYATARRTPTSATAIALANTPISQAIRQMARTACGLPAQEKKKKGFFW